MEHKNEGGTQRNRIAAALLTAPNAPSEGRAPPPTTPTPRKGTYTTDATSTPECRQHGPMTLRTGDQSPAQRFTGTGPSDHWCAVSIDSKGGQRPLIARPISQLAACVEAIANWLTPPPV
jgi:hypothetical protein